MDVVQNSTDGSGGTQVKSVPTMTSPLVKPMPDLDTRVSGVNNMEPKRSNKSRLVGIFLVVILAGIGTGYLISRNGSATNNQSENEGSLTMVKSDGTEVSEEGVKDLNLFPDKAEGEIQVNDGSLTKEGSHILIRPGGVDQTAYLTSSIVDLDKFVGKKVEIYGQTNTAQKAGWLLDVGYARVIN